MAEKKQNPYEELGRYEEETTDHPPAYTAEGPSTQQSRSPPVQGASFQEAPFQEPRYQQTPFQEPSFQQPPFQEPSFQQTPFQEPSFQTRHKPIAIPAVAPSSDSPFIRAYPPILQNYQLPKESFLAFLDQLNKDIAASPPLQVLDATGGILNSVPILFPLHWIGSAVSGLANMSSQGMSKSRTDSALKQANKDIFGPRGLRVEIAKLDALAHVAKLPILDSQGKVNRQAPLFLQLQNEAYMADAVANEREQQELNLGKRIWALQPWIAELEYEVLPWSSKSKLTRFNDSLKKYNEPKDQERKGMGMGRRDRERRSMGMGMGMGKRADVYSQGTKQEDPFKKALWLIIREVEMGERP